MNRFLSIIIISTLSIFGVSAQEVPEDFFNRADAFFKKYVMDGRVDYQGVKDESGLDEIVDLIADADLSGTDPGTKKAFYINAYNLLVIDKVLNAYPLTSVKKDPAFFTKKDIIIAGKSTSLTQLEKDFIFGNFPDPRLHFVLVCAAVSCPELASFAYMPVQLERQLNDQVKRALNNQSILDNANGDLRISEIFNWYRQDFGGSKEGVFDFIRNHRKIIIPASAKIKYLPYNWRLNDIERHVTDAIDIPASPSGYRYVVSSVIPQGQWEIKLFNNLYSQYFPNADLPIAPERNGFFTQTLNVLFGLKPKLNIGLSARYRLTTQHFGASSAFDTFGNSSIRSRSGITAIGSQIRFAPIDNWRNFSIQSTFSIPVGTNLEGEDGDLYIDWSNPSWQTQFFNDLTLSPHFSLFTEIDFFIEDIGSLNRFSTPATAIFSYFPVANITVYALGSYSPYWQENYDYFYQFGLGTKFQFSPRFEIEFLFTDFTTAQTKARNGSAATYNLGLRMNI